MTERWPRLSITLPDKRHPTTCQACGGSRDDLESELTVWREHDDRDRPEPILVVLCENCNRDLAPDGSAKRKTRTKTMIEAHPRLYRRSRDSQDAGAARRASTRAIVPPCTITANSTTL